MTTPFDTAHAAWKDMSCKALVSSFEVTDLVFSKLGPYFEGERGTRSL